MMMTMMMMITTSKGNDSKVDIDIALIMPLNDPGLALVLSARKKRAGGPKRRILCCC